MEEIVFDVQVELADEIVWAELLVGDGVIEDGDGYVDDNARCTVCGRLMFRPEDDEDDDNWEPCECGGSYDYDDSQHPLDIFLEEWVRDRYGPEATLGGFCPGNQPRHSPCAWWALKDRVLKHHPSVTDEQFDEMSHDDMRALLPPEEREEVLADGERWVAEMEALRAGREKKRTPAA